MTVGATALVLAIPLIGPAATADATPRDPACHGHQATIVGTDGADELDGTDGRDVIVSLGGSDTVHAGAGDDLICSGDGDDAVRGGAGADQLRTGYGTDVLWGGSGRDTLRGGGTIGGGPDRYLPGKGRDAVHGGDWNDRGIVDYSIEDHPVRVDVGRNHHSSDRLFHVDRILGTRFDDRIRIRHGRAWGLGGSDTLIGGGRLVDYIGERHRDDPMGRIGTDGRDTVRALPKGVRAYLLRGRDHFIGGPGKDGVNAATGGDRVSGGGKWDRLTILRPYKRRIRGIVRLARGFVPGKKRTSFKGFEGYSLPVDGGRIVGTRHRDWIDTTSNLLTAVIEGRGGDDVLWGDHGRVIGGRGDDRVSARVGRGVGGPGRDTVKAGHVVKGGRGDDVLIADSNSNKRTMVRGGPGRDRFRTTSGQWPGLVSMSGGRGRDRVDLAYAPAYVKRVRIDLGTQRLLWIGKDVFAGRYPGRIRGFEAVRVRRRFDSVLNGDAKDNRLIGGNGVDRIDGRGGRDTCRGEHLRNCERR